MMKTGALVACFALLASVANPLAPATLVLRVAYDGTGFSGWADTEPSEPRAADAGASAAARSSRQARAQRRHGLGGGGGHARGARTVQGTLARALWRVHGAEGAALEVRGASRTDAGVHARGQVCHVVWRSGALPYGGDLARFAHALNRMLPPGELAVTDAALAPRAADGAARFHATFDAREKEYRYRVCTRPAQDPMRRLYQWHRPRGGGGGGELDLGAAREAAAALAGAPRDFSCFRAAPRGSARARGGEGARDRGGGAASAVCALREVSIAAEAPGEYVVTLVGDRFLYKMCRLVAGTLVRVGAGELDPRDVRDAMRARAWARGGAGGARGARAAGPLCAPAHGLELHEVRYARSPFGGCDDGDHHAREAFPHAAAAAAAGVVIAREERPPLARRAAPADDAAFGASFPLGPG